MSLYILMGRWVNSAFTECTACFVINGELWGVCCVCLPENDCSALNIETRRVVPSYYTELLRLCYLNIHTTFRFSNGLKLVSPVYSGDSNTRSVTVFGGIASDVSKKCMTSTLVSKSFMNFLKKCMSNIFLTKYNTCKYHICHTGSRLL